MSAMPSIATESCVTLQLTADDHLASSINAVHLKDRLGDVETDCRNRLRSWLLRIVGALTAPTSMALTCRWRSRPSIKSRQNERDRPPSSFRLPSIVPRANSRRVLYRNLQFRIRESYEIRDLIMLFWITNLRRDHAVPIFCRSARIPSRCAAKLSERGRRDKTRSVQAIPAMDVHRTLILSDDLMQFDEDLFQGRTVVPLVILIL